MYPNEIIQLVKLPEHLANHPYLIEYYGTVEWSVKAVFTNYMGWYSGKASELHPLPYKEEAALLVDLAGGPDKMFEKLKQAYEADKFQWAIQLSDNLLEVGKYEREAKVSEFSFCDHDFSNWHFALEVFKRIHCESRNPYLYRYRYMVHNRY